MWLFPVSCLYLPVGSPGGKSLGYSTNHYLPLLSFPFLRTAQSQRCMQKFPVLNEPLSSSPSHASTRHSRRSLWPAHRPRFATSGACLGEGSRSSSWCQSTLTKQQKALAGDCGAPSRHRPRQMRICLWCVSCCYVCALKLFRFVCVS